MTSQQVYATGQISVTNGSAVFTGTGTAWDLSLLRGGMVMVAGQSAVLAIDEIVSDTSGRFVLPWPGATVSNANYAIFLETAQSANATESNFLLLEAAKRLRAGSIFSFNAAGPFSERATYNTRPKDFVFLATDGPELLFYVKRSNASGDWSEGQPIGGPRGIQGLPGADGSNGNNGWAPLIRLVNDGTRRVQQVHDWTGGQGTKPATGYIGPSGLVANIAGAVDVRGPTGSGTGDMMANANLSDLEDVNVARETLVAAKKSFAEIAGIAPSLDLIMSGPGALRDEWVSRPSVASYYDSASALRWAAVNEPRFNHDPATGEALGLLVEGARTNVITYSEVINAAIWNKTGTAVIANGFLAPDGMLTADKLNETATSGLHHVTRTSTYSANQTYTFSIYARASQRSVIALSTAVNASWAQTLTTFFNLSNGTVQSGTGVIEPVGNGWYRCSITATMGSSNASAGFHVFINGNTAYEGVAGNGVWLWGGQAEIGPAASSYIRTEESEVTRATENCSLPVSDFPFDADRGTLLVNFTTGQIPGSNRALRLYSTGTNYIEARAANASFFVATDGGTSAGIPTPAATGPNTNYRLALAFSNANFRGSRNGGAVTSIASGAVPATDTLAIGSTGANLHLFGHVRRVAYWTRPLPNDVLQELTR